MSKRAKLVIAGGCLAAFILFLINGVSGLDPDFGWHLRVGEMMLKTGIPVTDPYSYTMPGFPWVDHGRLSDVAIGWLYPKIGMEGMASIFAGIGVGILILIMPAGLWVYGLVPYLLGIGALTLRFGVRPQVQDWAYAALILRLIQDEQLWKKWRWTMPAVFIIWANFHGGFAMGLGIIFMRIIGRIWEERKIDFKDLLTLVLSAAATLLNPYGWKLWEEIWLTLSDASLRLTIAEWQPFYAKAEMGYWLLTALVLALLKEYGRGIVKWRKLMLGTLFFISLSSLRNVPFYVIAVIPLTAEGLYLASQEMRTNPISWFRAKRFYLLLVVISFVLFVIESVVPAWKLVRNGGIRYPVSAVNYMTEFGAIKSKIFSTYAWGGYLIWKLPAEKVFVDGRMPSWRYDYLGCGILRTDCKGPADESSNAFKDYQKIANEGKFEELFNKYQVGTVLWPKGDITNGEMQSWINFSNSGLWKWLVNKAAGKPEKSFVEKLVDKGWKKIYEDETSVIYISPSR